MIPRPGAVGMHRPRANNLEATPASASPDRTRTCLFLLTQDVHISKVISKPLLDVAQSHSLNRFSQGSRR